MLGRRPRLADAYLDVVVAAQDAALRLARREALRELHARASSSDGKVLQAQPQTRATLVNEQGNKAVLVACLGSPEVGTGTTLTLRLQQQC